MYILTTVDHSIRSAFTFYVLQSRTVSLHRARSSMQIHTVMYVSDALDGNRLYLNNI